MKPPETYILELTPVRDAAWAGVPGIVRLRKALKSLLRAHGLRCLGVTEAKPAEAAQRVPAEPDDQKAG